MSHDPEAGESQDQGTVDLVSGGPSWFLNHSLSLCVLPWLRREAGSLVSLPKDTNPIMRAPPS